MLLVRYLAARKKNSRSSRQTCRIVIIKTSNLYGANMATVEEVLRYWFGESNSDQQVLAQKGKLWFGKNEQVDRDIEARFGAMVVAASQAPLLTGDEPSAKRYLASILLLDQFTRNIYRDDARAFAQDSLALKLALDALDKGCDKALRPIERVFIYLPLEHSEDIELQNRSVKLFENLRNEVGEDLLPAFDSFLDYAIRHQEIIARFGRFPHRNAILGRTSTAEEREFLKQPNSSF